MAILEGVPGINVTVKIGDATCTEYEYPEPGDTHASSSKYIESIDDAEFGICCKISPEYSWGLERHALEFRVYIDGHVFDGILLTRPMVGEHGEIHLWDRKHRTETGTWVAQKPKFSIVTTGDRYVKFLGSLLS